MQRITKEDYSIVPAPEACSSLVTNYNIRTSGIVIGSNIESHAFSISKIGNSVDTLVIDVDQLEQLTSQLITSVESIQSTLDNFILIDTLIGFAEGIIAAGTEGAFKFGEKAAIEAGESGIKIGGDFDKTIITTDLEVEGESTFSEVSVVEDGSLATNTTKPTSGETVNIEGKITTTEATIGSDANSLSIYADQEAIALDVNGKNRILFDNEGDITLKSAAEGWSDEAFRAGREIDETTSETSSYVNLLNDNVSFRCASSNPNEVIMRIADGLTNGLRVIGNKVTFARNVIHNAYLFVKLIRFLTNEDKGIEFEEETENNVTTVINTNTYTLLENHQYIGIYGTCCGSDMFVYGNISPYTAYSTDGVNWSAGNGISLGTCYHVCYGNNMFVAYGNCDPYTAYSTDGINWTAGSGIHINTILDLRYDDTRNMFIVYGLSSPYVAYSTDGVNWSAGNGVSYSTQLKMIIGADNNLVSYAAYSTSKQCADSPNKAFLHAQVQPKLLTIDNGGEFVGEAFQNVLKEYGIEQYRTHPHTPQENGQIERFWLTIERAKGSQPWTTEKIRDIIHQYNYYWSHRSLEILTGQSTTPYEAWTTMVKYTGQDDASIDLIT